MADNTSKPDQTNADNPSKTGTPSTDSQGTNSDVKGGTVEEQKLQSDSDRNPQNHTVPYGADAKKDPVPASTESAREFAERGVVERHGEPIRTNPNFEKMVDEEQRQLDENARNTAGM